MPAIYLLTTDTKQCFERSWYDKKQHSTPYVIVSIYGVQRDGVHKRMYKSNTAYV